MYLYRFERFSTTRRIGTTCIPPKDIAPKDNKVTRATRGIVTVVNLRLYGGVARPLVQARQRLLSSIALPPPRQPLLSGHKND